MSARTRCGRVARTRSSSASKSAIRSSARGVRKSGRYIVLGATSASKISVSRLRHVASWDVRQGRWIGCLPGRRHTQRLKTVSWIGEIAKFVSARSAARRCISIIKQYSKSLVGGYAAACDRPCDEAGAGRGGIAPTGRDDAGEHVRQRLVHDAQRAVL